MAILDLGTIARNTRASVIYARSSAVDVWGLPPLRGVRIVDVLSEVLRTVRLTGALYFEVNAAHPWVAVTPSMRAIGATVMPGAQHVIPFHVVVTGQAWARPDDGAAPPERLGPGDIVMFPHGEQHILSSDRERWDGAPANESFYAEAAASRQPFTFVRIGADGERTQFVCGYLGCDSSPFNPLLDSLPRMLAVKPRGRGELVHELLRAALDERDNGVAGAESMLSKISELMFVQAIRRYMELLDEDASGWLAALRDEHVGHALRLIHSAPAADWTLARLAKECGLSRSVFSERFTEYAGEPPMHYLGRWRMHLAARLLSDGSSVGKAADDVGYSSDAAFQRAFKKFVGATPGEWRKRARPA